MVITQCIAKQCTNIALYNYVHITEPLYCSLHYTENMHIICGSMCVVPSCITLKHTKSNFCDKHTSKSYVCKIPCCIRIVPSSKKSPSVCIEHKKKYNSYKSYKNYMSYIASNATNYKTDLHIDKHYNYIVNNDYYDDDLMFQWDW